MVVGVIGSGTMGAGIAQVAATSGSRVILYDTSSGAIRKAFEHLDRIFNRLVEKGKLNKDQRKEIQSRIEFSSDLQKLKDSHFIIEAIIEKHEIKGQVFREIEDLVSPETMVATNTSSLSVTALAANLKKPDRFIGIHFFNPAPLMKLVEVIPALQTSKETTKKAMDLLHHWGKVTVEARDTPGFIVNKVARPFYGEALRILDEGIADHATIDWAMKEFGSFKMGPFELMDFIGNDVNFMVTETVFNAFYQDPRYRPSFTQKRLFEAGYLGRKSGRGYYEYGENVSNGNPNRDKKLGKYIFERILIMLINEAADTVHFGIASKEDVDLAMTNGVNYPKGLLFWADEIGLKLCVNQMDQLYQQYHEDRYRCSRILRQMASEEKSFFKAQSRG